MTGSICRGSNSTFNDDFHDKTSDLFAHKENNLHSEGKTNWTKIIEIENILHGEELSNVNISPSVFWDCLIEMWSHISLSIAGSQIQACLHFQQALSIEAWPLSCLWDGIKAPIGVGYTVTSSISRGTNATFNDNVHDKNKQFVWPLGKQFSLQGMSKLNSLNKPSMKAVVTVRDERWLNCKKWNFAKNGSLWVENIKKCVLCM